MATTPNNRGAAVEVADLVVRFRGPSAPLTVLDIPRLTIVPAAQLCLIGGSGTGKTTLLNVLAGITPASAGKVQVGSHELSAMGSGAAGERTRDRYRARHVGVVFQSFNLLQYLTAHENVALAGTFAGKGKREARAEATRLLTRLGLGHRQDALPGTMSVGEQQRVGIARALLNAPSLLLADEPTANLDDAGADRALALLKEVAEEQGATLVVVTHDARVKARFDEVLDLATVNRASAAAGVSGQADDGAAS